jgi:hypothetical protein
VDEESRLMGKIIIILLSFYFSPNTPPVITGVRTEKPKNMMVKILELHMNDPRILNNLKFHYNGVVSGKWSLSPKYKSLEELRQLIIEKENK